MVLNKLDALARALLPALVVSCKCDAPQRQLNPSNIENLGAVGGYETMQTSIASPDSQKKCLNVILNMIVRKNGLCAPFYFLVFVVLFCGFVALLLLLCFRRSLLLPFCGYGKIG